jgi:hypothetical protein
VANEERDRLLATLGVLQDPRIALWAFQYMKEAAHNRVVRSHDVVLRAERFGTPDEIKAAHHGLTQMTEVLALAADFFDLIQNLVVEDRLQPTLLKAIKTIK